MTKESINWASFCPAPFRRGQHEVYISRGVHCRACGAGQDEETFFSLLDDLGLTGPTSVERCQEIAATLPCREIRVEGELYMRRFYLAGKMTWAHAYSSPPVARCEFPGWAMYLHCFYKPDADRELHNHPWGESVSLVLNGGYTEDRRQGDKVNQTEYKPGDVNSFSKDVWHRISKLESNTVWTVCVVGHRVGDWGFWDPETGKYQHWRRGLETGEQFSTFIRDLDMHPRVLADLLDVSVPTVVRWAEGSAMPHQVVRKMTHEILGNLRDEP